jgi:hypothetical protein
MPDNSANSRDFNSMSVAGLSDEARQAVNTAFDAMSAWRIDIANSNEKNSEQVIEKMAAASRVLGWPEQTWTSPARSFKISPKCKSKYRTDDGYLGGADQITKSHDRFGGDALEAKIPARR